MLYMDDDLSNNFYLFCCYLPSLCRCAKGGTSHCLVLTFAPYNVSDNYLLIIDDSNYQAQSMLLIYIYILFNVGIYIYLFWCQMKNMALLCYKFSTL
jgi:hypothetical protein